MSRLKWEALSLKGRCRREDTLDTWSARINLQQASLQREDAEKCPASEPQWHDTKPPGGMSWESSATQSSVSQDKREQDTRDEARTRGSDKHNKPQKASQLCYNHLMKINRIMLYYGNDSQGKLQRFTSVARWNHRLATVPRLYAMRGTQLASFWGCVGLGGVPHITLKINFVSLAHCLLFCYFVTVLWIIGLEPCLKAGAVKP